MRKNKIDLAKYLEIARTTLDHACFHHPEAPKPNRKGLYDVWQVENCLIEHAGPTVASAIQARQNRRLHENCTRLAVMVAVEKSLRRSLAGMVNEQELDDAIKAADQAAKASIQ